MESARRFRALLSELGLKMPEAAQTLHVSLRTLHNWSSGVHEVPYCAIKLLRLQRHMELPGAWSGWHFTRGHLVTPEGRSIAAHEGTWWSLMVLRGRSFDKLAKRMQALEAAALRGPACGESEAAHGVISRPWYSDLCPQKSASGTTPVLPDTPDGNHGEYILQLTTMRKVKGAVHG